MDRQSARLDRDTRDTSHHTGKRPVLAGIDVRDHDLEPHRGLDVASVVFRVASVVIFLLAGWQFADWWIHRPPGGIGVGVLVGDTIRLIVISGLLWAASHLADLMIKTHCDVRAGRILLARQTSMMRQMGLANGTLSVWDAEVHRRGTERGDGLPADEQHP